MAAALQLDRTTVVVTGASSGLGREFARQLAPRARGIALVARRGTELDALKHELAGRTSSCVVSAHVCDLTDLDATDATLRAIAAIHGDIDVLVNNAGFASFGPFVDADWADIARMLRLNVEAHSYLVHRLLPGMLARRRGGILAVASGQGLVGLPGYASYAGTKHYVVGLTEGLQLELRDSGVVITLLCPGQTRTGFFEVAGPGSDRVLPAFMEMQVAPVVRAALRALERGRAIVIPGLRNRIALRLGRLAPRALRRLVLSLWSRRAIATAAIPGGGG